MIVYFHSDTDGKCAAALVKHKYPEAICIPVVYGEQPLGYTIHPNEEIYVVDYTFPIDIMNMLNRNGLLHWIDHHKDIVSKLKETGFTANGGEAYAPHKAGCLLTWEYLYGDKPAPMFVRLAHEYDMWHHGDPRTQYLNYGVHATPDNRPEGGMWQTLCSEDDGRELEKVLIKGKLIKDYQDLIDKKHVNRHTLVVDFEGHTALVVNYHRGTSEIFDKLRTDTMYHGYEIMLIFSYRINGPSRYKYSIRTREACDVDVGAIARKYGGNGHKTSAGFWSDKLVFENSGKKKVSWHLKQLIKKVIGFKNGNRSN